MKVSIITVVLNNKKYIEECIMSVLNQTYRNIEYIIIDGASTDGTKQQVKRYDRHISKWISEPDRGIYDAMNKGIRLATGDIVGLLNSDDFYAENNVISTIVKQFEENDVDSVFADLIYVNRDNPQRVVRYYRSSGFSPRKFQYGFMPAHTTFFAKRTIYNKYGMYKLEYKIAADYELLLRLLCKHNISYTYIPKVLIKMRTGGVSTRSFRSNIILNREIIKACDENGIKTNIFKVYSKYILKIWQLIERPSCTLAS